MGLKFELEFYEDLNKFKNGVYLDNISTKNIIQQIGISPSDILKIEHVGNRIISRKINPGDFSSAQFVHPSDVSDVTVTTKQDILYFSLKYGKTVKIANFGVDKLRSDPTRYRDFINAFGIDMQRLDDGFNLYSERKNLNFMNNDSEKYRHYLSFATNPNYIVAINLKFNAFAIRATDRFSDNASGLYGTGRLEKLCRIFGRSIREYQSQTNGALVKSFQMRRLEARQLTFAAIANDDSTQWFTTIPAAKEYVDINAKIRNRNVDEGRYYLQSSLKTKYNCIIPDSIDASKLTNFLQSIWGSKNYYYCHKFGDGSITLHYVNDEFIDSVSRDDIAIKIAYPDEERKQMKIFTTVKAGTYVVEVRSSHGAFDTGLEAKCSFEPRCDFEALNYVNNSNVWHNTFGPTHDNNKGRCDITQSTNV